MILAANRAQEGPRAPEYTCDPVFTRLFTPPRPLMGRYEVCTTDAPLDLLVGGAASTPAERYGEIEAIEALDAFGAAGTYKRSALSRVYSGTRVRVVRGWSAPAGRFESITLLSPYPDASLDRLLPGTMAIRWTIRR